MSNANKTTADDAQHVMPTYNRLPVSFVRGKGCRLYDNDGNEYIDALCGISVTNIGHAHPNFVRAVCEQAETLAHTSNLFHIEAQQKLANALCDIADMDNAFFCNSGTEASEAAIKLARLYAHNNGNHEPLIITFEGSFHGRTLAAISATAGAAIKAGFGPLLEGFVHLPLNDLAELEACFAQHSNIAAVLIEPVQGEGGINIATPQFLKRIEQLCQSHGALFMLDEVQSGNGRCGSYFAYQRLNQTENAIQPDVITTAKGLGNGFPIGACLAKGKAAATLVAGKHGSTFGGNPLACHTALAVVNTVLSENLCDRSKLLGEKIVSAISNALKNASGIKEIRSCGLMIGIELNGPCKEIMAIGLKNGIVLNVTADKVVRLLPPLIISDQEAQEIAEKTATSILEFLQA